MTVIEEIQKGVEDCMCNGIRPSAAIIGADKMAILNAETFYIRDVVPESTFMTLQFYGYKIEIHVSQNNKNIIKVFGNERDLMT